MKRDRLTDQELEIMKVVWERQTATVRDVHDELAKRRKVAYTTVMTMMNILEGKGFLKKKQQERAYVYRTTRPRQQVVRGMVTDFVNRVFNGAAEPLLLHLVEDSKLSSEDLKQIVDLLERGRKSRGES